MSHLIKWEPALVNSKVLIINHIIDVGPYSVEWKVVRLVVFYHVEQHGDVLVSPSALVLAETPKWRDDGGADE